MGELMTQPLLYYMCASIISEKKTPYAYLHMEYLVETRGLEPMTSRM